MVIETCLHSLKHGLVFPTCDPALLTCRALALERARLTVVRPIAAQCLAVLYVRIVIGQPLTSWTNINIVGRDIDEVLLAETALPPWHQKSAASAA